jgi:hypothetical protein
MRQKKGDVVVLGRRGSGWLSRVGNARDRAQANAALILDRVMSYALTLPDEILAEKSQILDIACKIEIKKMTIEARRSDTDQRAGILLRLLERDAQLKSIKSIDNASYNKIERDASADLLANRAWAGEDSMHARALQRQTAEIQAASQAKSSED